MKIWYGVIDASGNVHAKGSVEGTAREVIKQLISALFSGEKSLRQVDDLFNEHLLDAYTPSELVGWIADLNDDDEESDVLGLYEVSDEPGAFYKRVLALMDGDVGDDLEEVTETQTTLLVKLS